ncbi:MAG: fibronectin type III domain-containing protein [Armatimonadetes bacterium]|nr:fibronectin type III domain-containing protein [Armatimonadota bacterium]
MALVEISRRSKRMALVVAVAMVVTVGPLPGVASWAADQQPAPFGRELKLLLFPVIVEAGEAPSDMQRWASNALQAAIDDLPNFACIDFSRTSPLARRAVREGRVRAVDLEEPVTDARTAVEIGHAMDADLVLLAAVQAYKVSTEPVQVEVVLAGQAYDVKANFDEEAMEAKAEPQVFRAFGVVGKSRARARYDGPEGVLAREALREAAARAAQVLAGAAPEAVTAPPVQKEKHKAWRWFLFLAAAAALVAAANSGTSHKPPVTPSDQYRPRNFSATVLRDQNAIKLTWLPPANTTNMLGYELERAYTVPGSGAASAYTPVTTGLIQAGATEFVDTQLNSAYVYYYRLRARYSDRPYSAGDWVIIGGIGFTRSD